METLVIIVEADMGIFVGTVGGIGIFTKNDLLQNTKVYGFESRKQAESFICDVLPKLQNSVEYLEIATNAADNYVDAIDIIKAGHKQHAVDLFNNMDVSPTVH